MSLLLSALYDSSALYAKRADCVVRYAVSRCHAPRRLPGKSKRVRTTREVEFEMTKVRYATVTRHWVALDIAQLDRRMTCVT